MKPFQRLTALLLAVAMLLSLNCPAFATEAEPEVLPDASSLTETTETVEDIEITEDTEVFEEPAAAEEVLEAEEPVSAEEVLEVEDSPAAEEPLPEKASSAEAAPASSQSEELQSPTTSQSGLSYAESNDLLVSDDYMVTDDFGIKGEPEESWRFEDGEPVADDSEVIVFEGDEAPLNGATSYFTGIDVSKWQGTINWTKVAKKVSFAIIRCGYGTNSTKNDDSMFLKNVKGCLDNGIPFGVYLYSYGESAKSEANHVLRLLKSAGLSTKDVAFPVYLDMEDSCMITTSSKTYMSKTKMLTYVTNFCNVIENAGYDAGVYANSNWWKTYLTSSKYNQWDRWVARWGKMDYTGTYSMWQYSATGTVSGISGKVDMNRWYGKIPSASLTSTTPTLSSASCVNGTIQLSWSKVAGSKGYYVYRKVSGGTYAKIATVVGSTKTSYTDTTAKGGTSYIYCIKAYNSGSTSKSSASKTVACIATPSLKTAVNTAEGIQVGWKAVSGAGSYKVYRRVGSVSASRTCIATVDGSTLTWLDTNVTAGSIYYYDVQCVVGTATSGYTAKPGAAARMTAPKATVAHSSSTSKTGLKVSWNKITGATGYYVYRRAQETAPWTQIAKVTSGSTLSYVDTTPANGKSYSYAVTPYSAGATGLQSAATASILYLAAPKVTATLKGTTATIKWTASSANPDLYRVYRKVAGGSWVLLDELTPDQTSYTDPNALKKKTSYVYTVRPVKNGVAGCYSASGAQIYILSTGPAAPTATNTTTGLKLKWKKVTGATGYYVYRRTSASASWKKIATIKSGSTVTYTYKSAPSGKKYQYAIQAYNACSVSARSTKTAARYLKTPTFTLSNTSTTKVKVKWKKITGAKKYKIYRRTGTSGGFKLIKTTTAKSFTDKNLKKGKTYYYRIVACYGSVTSAYKTVKIKKK